MKKKDFTKFTKRNVHKRRSKEASQREILKALNEVQVEYSGLKIRDVRDEGMSRRKKPHSADEILSRGIYSSSKSEFGFVSLEEGGDDIFIPPGKSHGAIDGDFVEVRYHKFKNRYGEDKTEGTVLKIIEYGRKTVIGNVIEEYYRHGRRSIRRYYLKPDDSKAGVLFPIAGGSSVRVGDKVEALILRDGSSHPECEVIRSFGDGESRNANYAAILAECEIVTEFTAEEIALAERLSDETISYEGRTSLVSDVIFTIDGEGAKDLDDAVSLKRLPGGRWRLGVHIADVSHYVNERTALDRCVMARATSVYFTDKVVPMLPEALSNGACSLNAGEEKYAMSAIIDLDSDGNIIKTELIPSVIRSRVRGVYSEVNALLSEDPPSEIKKKYKAVTPTLLKMKELYSILAEKSKRRGAIDFDSDEPVIILSESGEPIDIQKRERGLSERIIEQFMLTANEAVATLLTERGVPCVYRIHEPPPKEGFESLLTYLASLGFNLVGISRENPTSASLEAIVLEAEARGIRGAVSYAMLRAMSKAKYSEELYPHFGLGIDTYCHFTSPIRRLSDLATHRIIRRFLFEGKRPESYSSYARRAAAAATEGEMRAVNAERRIENLYKVIYMSDKIGEIFPATISSVTSFGLFATLENTTEGLIPISEMDGIFTFLESSLALCSSDTAYRIGDEVYVKLEEANISRGNLRFSISSERAYLKQKRV